VSSIGWVDFSERERQRTAEVLRILDEPGSLDALGIGRIRDVFSDLFFPGTSTIQTRARYFLIVPWIYRELESRTPRRDPRSEVEGNERRLIDAFNEARSNGSAGDLDGLIGSQAGSNVQQLPSDIYWQGLEEWGIRTRSGPKRVFLLEARQRKIGGPARAEEEMDSVHASWWDRNLPEQPDDLIRHPTLALTEEEATYLRDLIAINENGTLLAHLVRQDGPLPDASHVWHLPVEYLDLPEQLASDLDHARRFSHLIHGSHILYYLMLAELKGDERKVESHRAALEEWHEVSLAELESLNSWFGDEAARLPFWATVSRSNPNAPSSTEKRFVEDWFNLAIGGLPASPDRSITRTLIQDRERDLKKERAKLSNPSAREYTRGPDSVGALDFRWGTVKRLIADIHEGLSELEDPDA